MKFKSYFIILAATAFLLSFIPREESLKEGEKVPEITFNNERTIELEKGKFTLLNFWNPKNPDSRIRNSKIMSQYSDIFQDNLEIISICTDSDIDLAKEVIRHDGFDSIGSHVFYSNLDERVILDYKVNEQPELYLIDQSGKLICRGDEALKKLQKL